MVPQTKEKVEKVPDPFFLGRKLVLKNKSGTFLIAGSDPGAERAPGV